MGKKEECEAGAPLWMLTFGDMMSLLLCFFVLLLSFSTMDPAMYKEVSGSLKQAFGVQRKDIVYDMPKGVDIISRVFNPVFSVDVILEKIKSAIKLELIKGEIQVEVKNNKVVLRMKDNLTFAPGSAKLTPRAKQILNKLIPVIKSVPGDIMVAGYTDNIPIHNSKYPSNWSLSAARAAAVVNYFVSKGHIDPNRIAAVGYGASRPLVPNDTPEHRAMNRRVEIIFLQSSHPEDLHTKPVTQKGLKYQEPIPPIQ